MCYLAAVAALDALARERFHKSVLALAVRWVLDQGPTIALWGARRPSQLDPVADVDDWHLDARTKADIDAILTRTVPDPVGPEFMAPPAKRPAARVQSCTHARLHQCNLIPGDAGGVEVGSVICWGAYWETGTTQIRRSVWRVTLQKRQVGHENYARSIAMSSYLPLQ